METVSKKKRGRPSIFYKLYGNDPTFRAALENMSDTESDRSKTNAIYYLEGMSILQRHLRNEGFRDQFFTSKGNKKRGQCIIEQIGRMSLQNNFDEESCNQIADRAIAYLNSGYTVRAVESWIRHGRNTNEW